MLTMKNNELFSDQSVTLGVDYREMYRGIIFLFLCLLSLEQDVQCLVALEKTVPFSNNYKLLRTLSYRSQTILAVTC